MLDYCSRCCTLKKKKPVASRTCKCRDEISPTPILAEMDPFARQFRLHLLTQLPAPPVSFGARNLTIRTRKRGRMGGERIGFHARSRMRARTHALAGLVRGRGATLHPSPRGATLGPEVQRCSCQQKACVRWRACAQACVRAYARPLGALVRPRFSRFFGLRGQR